MISLNLHNDFILKLKDFYDVKKINVTKTYLPNLEKFQKYIEKIFQNSWITNNGEFVNKLENKLKNFLGVKNIVLVANGTLALQIAYKLLNLKNEVITTPFSFVATVSSLVWENITPIFTDIHPYYFTIDADKIEKKISKGTTGVVGVHVFGNACEIEEIDTIAKKYQLKVIYDGAHCFGVKYKGKSILSYGDISIISFHATKLFHTIEGGALIINNDELAIKAKRMRNFGYEKGEIHSLGINAKMNEFEAAMGLCILDDIDWIIEQRKRIWNIYKNELRDLLQTQKLNHNITTYNYSYFPVIFDSEKQLKKVQKALNEENIYPRRYFYPSLDTLNYIEPKQFMPIARDISKRILCLPMYPELELKIQEKIIEIIKANL